jgi:hypothetical protein
MLGFWKGGRRALGAAVAVLTVLTLGLGMAGTAQAQTPHAGTVQLNVDMSAQRFAAKGGKVVARGPVDATVTRPDGTTRTITKRVTYKVTAARNCKIIQLHLAPLFLNLLGLEVRTSDINVQITGDRSGGVLGRLFCGLSQGLTLDQQARTKRAVHSLNKRLDKRGLSLLSFRASLKTAEPSSGARPLARAIPPVPPGSCEILNLMLGPLHLDLLGLVVDVFGETRADPVHVLVTANPAGGVLGELLCGVGGDPTEASPAG